MVRNYNDSDGPCFGSIAGGKGCKTLMTLSSVCGTYMCPFYKPTEYINWIRIDGEKSISLMPPEEYYGKHYYNTYTER